MYCSPFGTPPLFMPAPFFFPMPVTCDFCLLLGELPACTTEPRLDLERSTAAVSWTHESSESSECTSLMGMARAEPLEGIARVPPVAFLDPGGISFFLPYVALVLLLPAFEPVRLGAWDGARDVLARCVGAKLDKS